MANVLLNIPDLILAEVDAEVRRRNAERASSMKSEPPPKRTANPPFPTKEERDKVSFEASKIRHKSGLEAANAWLREWSDKRRADHLEDWAKRSAEHTKKFGRRVSRTSLALDLLIAGLEATRDRAKGKETKKGG